MLTQFTVTELLQMVLQANPNPPQEMKAFADRILNDSPDNIIITTANANNRGNNWKEIGLNDSQNLKTFTRPDGDKDLSYYFEIKIKNGKKWKSFFLKIQPREYLKEFRVDDFGNTVLKCFGDVLSVPENLQCESRIDGINCNVSFMENARDAKSATTKREIANENIDVIDDYLPRDRLKKNDIKNISLDYLLYDVCAPGSLGLWDIPGNVKAVQQNGKIRYILFDAMLMENANDTLRDKNELDEIVEAIIRKNIPNGVRQSETLVKFLLRGLRLSAPQKAYHLIDKSGNSYEDRVKELRTGNEAEIDFACNHYLDQREKNKIDIKQWKQEHEKYSKDPEYKIILEAIKEKAKKNGDYILAGIIAEPRIIDDYQAQQSYHKHKSKETPKPTKEKKIEGEQRKKIMKISKEVCQELIQNKPEYSEMTLPLFEIPDLANPLIEKTVIRLYEKYEDLHEQVYKKEEVIKVIAESIQKIMADQAKQNIDRLAIQKLKEYNQELIDVETQKYNAADNQEEKEYILKNIKNLQKMENISIDQVKDILKARFVPNKEGKIMEDWQRDEVIEAFLSGALTDRNGLRVLSEIIEGEEKNDLKFGFLDDSKSKARYDLSRNHVGLAINHNFKNKTLLRTFMSHELLHAFDIRRYGADIHDSFLVKIAKDMDLCIIDIIKKCELDRLSINGYNDFLSISDKYKITNDNKNTFVLMQERYAHGLSALDQINNIIENCEKFNVSPGNFGTVLTLDELKDVRDRFEIGFMAPYHKMENYLIASETMPCPTREIKNLLEKVIDNKDEENEVFKFIYKKWQNILQENIDKFGGQRAMFSSPKIYEESIKDIGKYIAEELPNVIEKQMAGKQFMYKEKKRVFTSQMTFFDKELDKRTNKENSAERPRSARNRLVNNNENLLTRIKTDDGNEIISCKYTKLVEDQEMIVSLEEKINKLTNKEISFEIKDGYFKIKVPQQYATRCYHAVLSSLDKKSLTRFS